MTYSIKINDIKTLKCQIILALDNTLQNLTLLAIVTSLDDEGSILEPSKAKAALKEDQEEIKGDARGVTGLEKSKTRNFVLVFGCKSGMGIDSKSLMAKDFCVSLLSSLNTDDLTCQLSDVLD